MGTREQLMGQLRMLRDELDREREDRNFYQLERDKINTFWEITKRQLEETNASLRNKDREMEEFEEQHTVEIKVYKQKVKLEDVLDAKNAAIKDLQYELARACKAHNDVIRTYEGKLGEFGIPLEELGFKPVAVNPGQPLGMGPA